MTTNAWMRATKILVIMILNRLATKFTFTKYGKPRIVGRSSYRSGPSVSGLMVAEDSVPLGDHDQATISLPIFAKVR